MNYYDVAMQTFYICIVYVCGFEDRTVTGHVNIFGYDAMRNFKRKKADLCAVRWNNCGHSNMGR